MTSQHSFVHPTAIIAPGAVIGSGVQIGPFCTIGPDVSLGDGVHLVSHVVVDGHTTLGAGVQVSPFATIGLPPQDLKYKGEPTRCEIGPGTLIREHCSIHRGTPNGGGLTRIGARCMLMAVVHVAHDCALGDGVIVANNVVMGGHVQIADGAVIGGAAAIHQFVRIGRAAMVGGVSGVERDVIPFGSCMGNRARIEGLNMIGLQRRGVEKAQRHTIRQAFRQLFPVQNTTGAVFEERLAEVRRLYADDAYVAEMLAFIDAPSRRGLMQAAIRRGDEDEA